MKSIQYLIASTLAAGLLSVAFSVHASDTPKSDTPASPKVIIPYTLKTCLVTGEKLGDMGKPILYTNGVHQIKFCCPGCVKTFKKDPDKYMKLYEELEAKAKEKK
jgi:hypothetical protein